jgi:Zn-dependent alcohol dehydrogenase
VAACTDRRRSTATYRSCRTLSKRGEPKLDELISGGIKLEEVDDALTAMESGEVARR